MGCSNGTMTMVSGGDTKHIHSPTHSPLALASFLFQETYSAFFDKR